MEQKKRTGVGISRDETGNVRGAQFRDPVVGRPEIEVVMAYKEKIAPPPVAKKPSTSHPLPWKVKELQHKKAAAAALQNVQRTMWNGINQRPAAGTAESAQDADEATNRRLQAQLPAGPIPVNTTAPQSMGDVRVVGREQSVPFAREIAPSVLAATRVKPLGSNLPPPDGRMKIVPIEAHDPATDVIAFRPKPTGPAPMASKPEVEVDILGRPVVQRVLPKKPETAPEDIARENDHFKKIMSRHILVDIAKEKAAQRDTTTTKGNVPLDIFNKPIPNHQLRIPRQSMFPGDEERLTLFQDGKPALAPMTEKARQEMMSFPSYIQNPPKASDVRVAKEDLLGTTDKIGQRPTGKVLGTQTSKHVQHQREGVVDFAVPGLGTSSKAAPATFYQSSVYNKVVVGCGLWGLRPLRQSLRAMDKNNDGILARSEFINGCLKAGIDLDEAEITALMLLAPPKRITPEGKPSLIPPKPDFPNAVLIPTLLDALRGGDLLVKRRLVLVAAYQKVCALAKKSPHSLTLEDIMNVTDFSAHPQFAPHIKGSMRELMHAYSAAWGAQKARTSVVTEEEFIGFFHDFCPCVKSDTDFVRIVKAMHSL